MKGHSPGSAAGVCFFGEREVESAQAPTVTRSLHSFSLHPLACDLALTLHLSSSLPAGSWPFVVTQAHPHPLSAAPASACISCRALPHDQLESSSGVLSQQGGRMDWELLLRSLQAYDGWAPAQSQSVDHDHDTSRSDPPPIGAGYCADHSTPGRVARHFVAEKGHVHSASLAILAVLSQTSMAERTRDLASVSVDFIGPSFVALVPRSH